MIRYSIPVLLFLFFIPFLSESQEKEHMLPVPEHEHLLKIDSLKTGAGIFLPLLDGKNDREKVALLNSLSSASHLKSTGATFSLDSVVVTAFDTETQQVVNALKILYESINEGRTRILRYNEWLKNTGKWKTQNANYYFFDEAGSLFVTEFQEYVVSNYRRYIRTEYTYQDGLLRYALRRERIDEIETWTELDRTAYLYNEDLRLAKILTQKWSTLSEKWNTVYYLENSYDSSGNLVAETGYDYDSYEDLSTQKSLLTYEYNEYNRLTRIVEYIKGWQTGQFVQDRKQENEYDAASNLISESFYDWDYDAGDWMPVFKNNLDPVVSGNRLYAVNGQKWQENWVDRLRSNYLTENYYSPEAISDFDFLEGILPLFVFEGVVCEQIATTLMMNATWQDVGTTRYYFSSDWPVGIENNIQPEIKIYPNPVSEKLIIETGINSNADCRITDVSGRLIRQSVVLNRESVNVGSLPNGLYLIELWLKGERLGSGKFIKK